jgi:hypothetical protein
MDQTPEEETCVFPPRGEHEEPDCAHDSMELLGSDGGNNRYDQCLDCGSVVVTFTAKTNWEHRREERSPSSGDWNPLLDALRGQQAAADDSAPDRRVTGVESLTSRVRGFWKRIRVR